MFLFMCVGIPPLAVASTFKIEKKQVKREIAVNSYSIGSYYATVIIYELILGFISVLTLIIGVKFFAFKNFLEWKRILLISLGYVSSINFCVFITSIFSNDRISVTVCSVLGLTNLFPLVPIVLQLKATKDIAIDSFLPVILNIFPIYTLSNIDLFDIYKKEYDELIRIVQELSNSRRRVDQELIQRIVSSEILLKCVGNNLTSFSIDMRYGYLIVALFFILYFFAGSYFIGRQVRASTRLRLSER